MSPAQTVSVLGRTGSQPVSRPICHPDRSGGACPEQSPATQDGVERNLNTHRPAPSFTRRPCGGPSVPPCHSDRSGGIRSQRRCLRSRRRSFPGRPPFCRRGAVATRRSAVADRAGACLLPRPFPFLVGQVPNLSAVPSVIPTEAEEPVLSKVLQRRTEPNGTSTPLAPHPTLRPSSTPLLNRPPHLSSRGSKATEGPEHPPPRTQPLV